ncbi:MAG: hypothetical protein HC830_13355 [Bacteroidetes bacterium]|nr:hypothetical protein [Bacteroidota bacterium]
MLTTRLNMRTFVHLRDTQYFGLALASVTNALTSINKLKDLLTIKEIGNLLGNT